nr:MAG TPA: hypothetical protein [Siphoviridae sp. ctnoo6]
MPCISSAASSTLLNLQVHMCPFVKFTKEYVPSNLFHIIETNTLSFSLITRYTLFIF